MDKEKYVDESWKEQASKEKEILKGSSEQQADQKKIITNEPPTVASDQSVDWPESSEADGDQAQAFEVNFLNYVTSLGFQAMIFMGEIPNPVTNATEENLVQAKFLIDTLAMLKEKTIGNLSDQEKDLLENTVYELQMRYIQLSTKKMSSEGNE